LIDPIPHTTIHLIDLFGANSIAIERNGLHTVPSSVKQPLFSDILSRINQPRYHVKSTTTTTIDQPFIIADFVQNGVTWGLDRIDQRPSCS
jgi:hypothetical protein